MIKVQNINGLKIACWVNAEDFVAERKNLVFIHGAGGDHTVWIYQYSRMKNDFNIAVVNLPGHGRSNGNGERDVLIYAKWVKKVIEGLAMEQPVLIGQSLGAAIALSFAIKYPNDLAGVVSLGSGLKMPVNPAILDGLRKEPGAIAAMAGQFAIAPKHQERLSNLLSESMLRVHPDILYGDFFACNNYDITETASRIKAPVLVVCGEEDRMASPKLSRALAESIPAAKLAMIPGAGHFVMLEEVDAFNEILGEFIAGLP